MAIELDDGSQLPSKPGRGPLFHERYPDYVSWLNGNTWELSFEELGIDKDTAGRFRAALHYQAREQKSRLVTRTLWRDGNDGDRYQVILVRAVYDS